MEATETYKTLRDEIAIEAFKSLLTVPLDKVPGATRAQVCRAAYQWADAMLKAREAE